jgi:hypothetical protein
MEPYHELQFTADAIPDWRGELRSLGYLVEESSPSWLGRRFPQFVNVHCRREGGGSALFAVGQISRSGRKVFVFVYVNILADRIAQEIEQIRGRFESLGATWDYFDG